METLRNLGRMLVAGLLVLMVALPTSASASGPDDAPLSDVPSAYVPALRAAAEGLGLSYDELTSASEDELRTLLCDKLDEMPTDAVVAQARAALREAPEAELAELSDAERRALIADLPAILAQVESRYCDGDGDATTGGDGSDGGDAAAGDDGATGDAGASGEATSGGDIPVPTRVDTGGGGAGGAGPVPAAFGALFAALFGLVGLGVTGRRPTG